jgi:hypothetical protein
VAAELTYGSGRVTLLGFDPTTKWLAESKSVEALWRAALPARSTDGAQLLDDSRLVQSVYQLPSLALPPTSGLLILIGAYIVIIGPINYFILKRLDRRELAWITMPLLVLAFTAASFGYGFLLRGTDVVVNEVAIVRGAPDATEASAQVYFGVFSPTRATYQVSLPQGALVAAPIADPFGQGGSTLDIVQGTGQQLPSMVRNLSVGTSSLRVVRAELPVEAPRMRASLTLDKNQLKGTFENVSDEKLENVAVVLGSAVAALGDVEAHAKVTVSLRVDGNPFGAQLADQIVGQSFDQTTEAGVRRAVRYGMINQLTFDPGGGKFSSGSLPADQAVILAFGRRSLLDVQLGGQEPRRSANVLYYVPVSISIHGPVTFSQDLIRPTVVDSDAQFFNTERLSLSMGLGTATLSYRPIPFDGTFTVSQLGLSLGNGNEVGFPNGKEIEPLASIPVACTDVAHTTPKGCQPPRNDFLPEVEIFDRRGEGLWVRLPRLAAQAGYTLADPSRYVDPATGQVLVRFVNESPDPSASVGFSFQLTLVGDVE